jgi:hypothetical protein
MIDRCFISNRLETLPIAFPCLIDYAEYQELVPEYKESSRNYFRPVFLKLSLCILLSAF